ncbi:hypothetical protein ACTVH1_09685 [Gluconobacter cerinus]
MMQSFQDNPALKRSMLQKAQAFQASDDWNSRPVYWNGKGGSLVGGLLGSDDLDQWVEEFGLPKWMALLLDMVAVTLPSAEDAKAAQISLLEALPVGADLNACGNVVLVHFLKEAETDIASLSENHPLRAALTDVMALHDAELAGKSPQPAEWRKARSEAIAATDQAVPDSLEAKFGAVIEAAAWNPRTSRSVVADTFRSWINARRDAAVQQKVGEQGLISFEETKKLLDRIHTEERKTRKDPKEFIHVFGILEERYPKEHKDMMDFHRIQHEEAIRQRQAAFQIIISTLKNSQDQVRCTC